MNIILVLRYVGPQQSTSVVTFHTSFTPGSMFVVLDIICVKKVANIMCHVVRNIGNGNFIWSSTALLKRIYMKHVIKMNVSNQDAKVDYGTD